jgi:hypothetical protein
MDVNAAVIQTESDIDLKLSDIEIMELQTEDALGIPDLGASSAYVLSCSSLCCCCG